MKLRMSHVVALVFATWAAELHAWEGDLINNKTNWPRAVTFDADGRVGAIGHLGARGIVLKFDQPDGKVLWRRQFRGRPLAVAASQSDLIVAGARTHGSRRQTFVVAKYGGLRNKPLWVHDEDVRSPAGLRALAVAVDANGDIGAAGVVTGSEFNTVKLNGNSGERIWGSALVGNTATRRSANALSIDGAGNFVTAGAIDNTFVVVKLAGANGNEIWSSYASGTDGAAATTPEARDVRATSAGDVVAGGRIYNTGTGADFVVVKLAAANGSELWRALYSSSGDDVARRVVFDSAGDVLAFGELGTGLSAIKLDGTTGAEIWRRDFPNTSFVIGGTLDGDLVLGAGNDAVVTYTTNDPTPVWRVVRLAALTGSAVWQQDLPGNDTFRSYGLAVAVEGVTGNVAAIGSKFFLPLGSFISSFSTALLDGTTGAP